MPPIPPSERSVAARAAAELSWAHTTNRSGRTASARAALWQKFLDEVDCDEVRARHLWKAHFSQLALKSAQARRRVKEASAVVAATETERQTLGATEDRLGGHDA